MGIRREWEENSSTDNYSDPRVENSMWLILSLRKLSQSRQGSDGGITFFLFQSKFTKVGKIF